MELALWHNLPFIKLTVAFQGQVMNVDQILVDTGSATTVLSADLMAQINIVPSLDDILYTIRGVGGTETVFSRQVDFLQVGNSRVPSFEVEIAGMRYGFPINGILGMDFLLQAGAVISLPDMTIAFTDWSQ